MKAIVYERYGPDAVELRDVPQPEVGDDQVLVRVRASSVNPVEWYGVYAPPFVRVFSRQLRRPKDPSLGSDVAGTVEAVGRDVTALGPGDDVFGSANAAWAEQAVASATRLARKPAAVSFEEAAGVPIAGLTALQAVRDHGGVRPGQQVLINGASGGVGTFAVQIAKVLGANVTAVSSPGNVDLLRSIGADEVIDYTREDFTKRGERYDVLFDVGSDRSFAECRRALAPNGRCVLVGAPAAVWKALWRLLEMQVMPGRDTGRIAFMTRVTHDDLVVLKDLAEAGKIRPVIDREYPLSGTADAIRRVGTRQVRGKAVIVVS